MDLLTTKLYMPPLRPNLVARPHLLRRLDEGVRHGRALTLVSAPAGYGKTTLIVAWLQHQQQDRPSPLFLPSTWLSLDDDDNDPLQFFAYLLAALQKIGLDLAATEQYLQDMAQIPPQPTLVTTLLNEISQANDGRSLTLVLDDYHKIQTAVIHDALQFWLDHAPPNLHLVLITREDPPLTLSRWRVRNQMTEIRAGDLRFTLEETADFLNQTMNLSLTAGGIAVLEQRTEGWIAGLQLAAIALQFPDAVQGRPNVADFIAAFSGSHHYIIDYLVEEVLRQEEEGVRDFLRETAVLNRLNPSLCDAVTGRSDSQAILTYLERRNLFLVPLDNQRYWSRYHHLLADSLRAGLDETSQTEGHRRAAAWFAGQNLYAEAIDHADAAGDTAQVAHLVRLASEPALQKGKIRQIAAWLKRLPQEIVIGDPELGIFWLLSLILTGRSHEAPAAIATLEQHHEIWQNQRQQARLLVVKAWVADITDSDERITLAQQAAGALSEDDPLFSAFVSVPLGHAYLYQGQLQEAVTVFGQGLASIRMRGMPVVEVSLLGNLIHNLNRAGQRREAVAVCRQAIAEFVDGHGNPLPSAGLPYLLSAWLEYDANQPDRAQKDLAQGRELMRQAFRETMLTPLEIELAVLLHEAAGETEQAQAAVRAGLERATTQQYQHGIQSISRIEAELHLRHGQLSAVRDWVEAQPIFSGRQPGAAWQVVEPIHDAAYLTYTRLRLVENQVEEVKTLLPLMVESARAGDRGRRLILMLLLQAVVSEDPLPYLREAVQRAAAEQYLRLIIDECTYPAHGPRLISLLRQDAVRDIDPAFVDKLLAALPGGEPPAPSSSLESAVNAARLAEPLTEQELVVLRLLATGLSNREIAEELVITVGTAKWHVHNIYQKMGVNSRAEAIARIHEW